MALSSLSSLRAAINRKMQFDGDYRQDGRAIYLDDVYSRDLSGVLIEGPLNDGTTAIVTTQTVFSLRDRVVLVKLHPDFYKNGLVSCPSVIDPSDGRQPVRFRFECTTDGFDPRDLPWAVKLYVFDE